jgi:hypothetical protein
MTVWIISGQRFGKWKPCFGLAIKILMSDETGCRNRAASWAEWSGVPFGRVGVLGQASHSAYGVKPVGTKSGAGAGAIFFASERARKRNGGQADAEWRLPSWVTTAGEQPDWAGGVET